MSQFFLLFVALLITGCATRSPQTDLLLSHKNNLPPSALISNVPFHDQAINHCGPATLTMAMQYSGKKVTLEEVTKVTFTPGLEGTFKTDILSATRRFGLLAVPVDDMTSLLTEISLSRPVIVFQNLGFKSFPKWHFAVATGYDLSGPDIILHTGEKQYDSSDLRFFERSWNLAGYWGVVILNPGELSLTATELEHVAATASLEQTGHINEAQTSYLSILKRWPESFGALIGMGNVLYAKGKFKNAINYLKEATALNPLSAVAWHNLATTQEKALMKKAAKESAQKALQLVTPEEKPKYLKSLEKILK